PVFVFKTSSPIFTFISISSFLSSSTICQLLLTESNLTSFCFPSMSITASPSNAFTVIVACSPFFFSLLYFFSSLIFLFFYLFLLFSFYFFYFMFILFFYFYFCILFFFVFSF